MMMMMRRHARFFRHARRGEFRTDALSLQRWVVLKMSRPQTYK